MSRTMMQVLGSAFAIFENHRRYFYRKQLAIFAPRRKFSVGLAGSFAFSNQRCQAWIGRVHQSLAAFLKNFFARASEHLAG